jgi:hypothetical protein
MLQAERQKEGQEPEKQTGYKAIVNQNHSNGTTAPSRKSFPALVTYNVITRIKVFLSSALIGLLVTVICCPSLPSLLSSGALT